MNLNLTPTTTSLSPLVIVSAICLCLAAVFMLSSDKARAGSVDIDKVFNCSPEGPIGEQTPEQCLSARETLFDSCTACHTFVPVVKAQKSSDAWDALLSAHRATKVPESDLSEAAFEELKAFLKSHYNETEPAPMLPPELEALGINEAA